MSRDQDSRNLALRAAFVGWIAAVAPGSVAAEDRWSITVSPIYLETQGDDPLVLVQQTASPSGAITSRTGVDLVVDSEIAYRAELRRGGEKWDLGLDFFWHRVPQAAGPEVRSGGPEVVSFELPTRTFVSTGPGQVLYYEVLEDTTIETWTVDTFATRKLHESEKSELGLRLGIKFTDFDNDYRAAAGFRNGSALKLDSSSNYDRMQGPLVGLEGTVRFGRSRLEALLAQSVVWSTVQLTSQYRDFAGSLTESTVFSNESRVDASESVTIPITEVRLRWSIDLGDHFTVGVGGEAAAWTDLPLPPGVDPAAGAHARREETVVFLGFLGSVSYRF